MLKNVGGVLVNVDIMLICEWFKVGFYWNEMWVCVVELFGFFFVWVNIKVIIIEKFGFIGCCEGVVV